MIVSAPVEPCGRTGRTPGRGLVTGGRRGPTQGRGGDDASIVEGKRVLCEGFGDYDTI